MLQQEIDSDCTGALELDTTPSHLAPEDRDWRLYTCVLTRRSESLDKAHTVWEGFAGVFVLNLIMWDNVKPK